MIYDLEKILAGSVLGALPESARRALIASSTTIDLPAHAPVLVEGEPSTAVFLLCAGSIRVFHGSTTGLEVALMFCRAPALFGEIEAVLKMAHIEHVATLEPSALLKIPNELFLAQLDASGAFARRMVTDVTAKLAMASHNQKALAFQDITTRLATLFVDHAAFRGKKMLDGIELQLPFTQDDMAQALGITRRAVSKVITQWLEEGLISRRGGRYVLHKLRRLTELAAAEHIGLAYDDQTGLTIIQPEDGAEAWAARPV